MRREAHVRFLGGACREAGPYPIGAMLAVGHHFLVNGRCVPSWDTSVVLFFRRSVCDRVTSQRF